MLDLWLSFQGRATRSDYWLRVTIPLYVIMVVLAIGGAITAGEDGMSPLMIVYAVFAIFSIWPSLAISVKRLHDRDQSGWWVLVGLIPILGGLYLFVVIGCLRGTVGENRFGPDPLGGEVAMDLDAE